MATATQLAGGPLLNGNIPPGMTYTASSGAWYISGITTLNAVIVNGTLQSSGLHFHVAGVKDYVTAVTDTVTLNATHNVVVCNKATAMTVNLPAVASSANQRYIIKNKGAGVVTIDANASEQIDNAATIALNQWQKSTIVCDGAIWCVI